MKKTGRFLVVMMALTMLISLAVVTETQAATKKSNKKVTYTLKDGTLTIKGKGKMPKNMTFEYDHKIKKVVIKKGVTSIPREAFKECYNLKKVKISNTVKKIGKYCFEGTAIEEITIPRSVKVIGQQAFDDCENLEKVTMPGGVDINTSNGDKEVGIGALNTDKILESVTFNTNFKVKSAPYFKTMNLYVMENDKKFKSVDGVVYTKDGKSIVRVPNARERVEIIDGCEEFCLQSVVYWGWYWEGDGVNYCRNLISITVPESIKNIDDTKYKKYSGANWAEDGFSVGLNILTDKLTGNDFAKLLYNFRGISCAELQVQLPDKIKESNGMYVSFDGVLLGYEGKSETITIPDTVTSIGDYAFFENSRAKKINIPDTVTSIGKCAFYYSLAELNKLPNKLEKVGDYAFSGCKGFENDQLILPETLKTIGDGAFKFIGWTKLVIPESVTKVGDEAFLVNCDFERIKREVTIKCDSKNISNTAFTWYRVDCKNLELNYENEIKNSKAYVYLQHNGNVKNNKLKVKIIWTKVSDVSGYKIEVSTNKNFKKNTKVIWARKKVTCKKIKVKNVNDNADVFARIRPYKKINGKKVYGKWVKAR